MISILLIEDEVAVAKVLETILIQNNKFSVINVPTLSQGLGCLKSKAVHFDIVLLDLDLPDSKGYQTLATFQTECPQIPFVVVSGDGTLESNPIRFGAQDFIKKGEQTYPTMEHIILHAVERHKVRQIFTPLNDLIQDARQMTNAMKAELKEDKRKGEGK